jgi:hypothetical protein
MIGETRPAKQVLGRVTRELADPRWAHPASAARHADFVRGRAFEALAAIALESDDTSEATDLAEAAVELLAASADDAAIPSLESLAVMLEVDLDRSDAAMETRAVLERLLRRRGR